MRIVELFASLPPESEAWRFDMKIRRVGSLTLSLAAIAVMGLAVLPARAANVNAASLDDGRPHGFSGCLTQEPTGARYFDLKNAKTDDGKTVGTLRLTSSLPGIPKPEDSLNREVHVIGDYRGHAATDPDGGHVAVEGANMTGSQCS
jgi:hypothetical protein